MPENRHVIIVGAGLSGLVAARIFAKANYCVDVYEKRGSIGGNVYDFKDEDDILIQKYGPHIFHTSNQEVIDFLSGYTEWVNYEHKVLGVINDQKVPIPFNLTSLAMLYPKDEADYIKDILINEYGLNQRVPIMQLKKNTDKTIQNFATFVYQNVFHNYTLKQWELEPEVLGENVMQRVPVSVSYQDNYFKDTFQMMPKEGFTALLTNMVNRKNITIHLDSDATSLIKFNEKTRQVLFNGKPTKDFIIFTGCLDALFAYKYGQLQYRTLDFWFEKVSVSSYQEAAVVNYPNSEKFTRITEFTKFTCPQHPSKTVICKEFSRSYDVEREDIPYYPIEIESNLKIYQNYVKEAQKYPNLFLLGRLAQYKYMNMDLCIAEAIKLSEFLIGRRH